MYVSTGNTLTGDYWQEGNAVLRLTSAPMFRNITSDYFRPENWSVCYLLMPLSVPLRLTDSLSTDNSPPLMCPVSMYSCVAGCRKDYDNRDIDLCGSHPVLFDFNGCAPKG